MERTASSFGRTRRWRYGLDNCCEIRLSPCGWEQPAARWRRSGIGLILLRGGSARLSISSATGSAADKNAADLAPIKSGRAPPCRRAAEARDRDSADENSGLAREGSLQRLPERKPKYIYSYSEDCWHECRSSAQCRA